MLDPFLGTGLLIFLLLLQKLLSRKTNGAKTVELLFRHSMNFRPYGVRVTSAIKQIASTAISYGVSGFPLLRPALFAQRSPCTPARGLLGPAHKQYRGGLFRDTQV